MGAKKRTKTLLCRWDGEGVLRRTRDAHLASIMLLVTGLEEVQVHGKYTAHDRYMGHPWSSDLDRFIAVLRSQQVPHRRVCGDDDEPFMVDDAHWLRSVSIWFPRHSLKRLRRSVIR